MFSFPSLASGNTVVVVVVALVTQMNGFGIGMGLLNLIGFTPCMIGHE